MAAKRRSDSTQSRAPVSTFASIGVYAKQDLSAVAFWTASRGRPPGEDDTAHLRIQVHEDQLILFCALSCGVEA